MPKRAERRHHEERVKDKFRRVARDIWTSLRFLSDRERREAIEHQAVRRAHHPRHQCSICRLQDSELRDHRHREIERKAPLIYDD